MSTPLPEGSAPLRSHEAAYRRLLLLYPAEFRRSHGELMAQLFRDQCRDARRSSTGGGLLALWRHTLLDTGKAASREHLASLRKCLSLDLLKPRLRTPPMDTSKTRLPWRLVAAGTLVGLVGLAVAAMMAWRQPDQFRANSILSTPPKISITSQQAAEIRENSAENTLALMTTDAVLQRVIAKLQEGSGHTNKLARPVVSATPGAGGTFWMTVTSTNFEFSRQFATAWAQEFVDYKKQARRNLLGNTEAQNTQFLLQFEKRLDQTYEAFAEFQKKNNVVGLADAGGSAQSRLDTTKAELQSVRNELRDAEGSTAEQLAATVAGNRWFDLKLEVKRAENRLAASPDDAALKAELALRQADVRSFLELTGEMRLAKTESLRRRSDSSAMLIEEFTREVFDTATLRNEYLRLKEDESRMLREVQDFRSRATSMDRFNADEEQLTIVQLGGGDARPVGPNRPYLLSLGLGLGALGGLLLAVLRALFRGPRDPGSPGALTPGLPAIARG